MKKNVWNKVLWMSCMVILMLSMTGCNVAKTTEEIISDVQVTETQESEESAKEQPETEDSKPEVTSDKETDEKSDDSEQKETAPKKDTTSKEESKDDTKEEISQEVFGRPSSSGALHVDGTQLKDSKGNNIQLRGISTHGLAWFPQYVNQELFHELSKEWNANVVRLAMYTAENNGYCEGGNKEELKKLVKDGVSYASNADMYVIVDWHVLRDENPNKYKEEAKKFFEEMSKEFANADNVIYEICNEPNGSTSWAEVKSYANEMIPVIRANDKDAVIIVGTPTWCQDVDKAAADPITEFDNIMYGLHFYATTHTDWLRDRMNQAIDSGLPIFVSEFGTCDASGNGAFDEYQSNEWIKALDAKGVSYVTWNLSNKNETSSIFSDGCSKTSGFTQEDLSQNGKWIYALLTRGHEVGNSEESSQTANTQTANTQTGTTGDFKYTATVNSSWESEGKTFYQYKLDFENTSGKDIDGWELTITFDGDIELSNGWNGEYSVSGNKLKIKSMDYNGKVPADGKVSDIGFIVSGKSGMKVN